MIRWIIVLLILVLLIGYQFSWFIPPVATFLHGGFFRVGDFSENLYSTSACDIGTIDVSLFVDQRYHINQGGLIFFTFTTNPSYQFWLNSDGERKLIYETPWDAVRNRHLDYPNLHPTIEISEIGTFSGDREIDIGVSSAEFTREEYRGIRDCVTNNRKEIESIIQARNERIPNERRVYANPPQIFSVYYY